MCAIHFINWQVHDHRAREWDLKTYKWLNSATEIGSIGGPLDVTEAVLSACSFCHILVSILPSKSSEGLVPQAPLRFFPLIVWRTAGTYFDGFGEVFGFAEPHDDAQGSEYPLDFEPRVIDCVTRQIVRAPICCHYVALSNVWGETEQMPRGEAPDTPAKFPMVVEDSIAVVQELGYRYLWVDRHVSFKRCRASKWQLACFE